MKKLLTTAALLSGLLMAGSAMALPTHKKVQGVVRTIPITAGSLNCDGDDFDICIENSSTKTIYVNIPDMNIGGFAILQPGANGFSSNDYPYNSIAVKITNSSGGAWINNDAPNHDIIDVIDLSSPGGVIERDG